MLRTLRKNKRAARLTIVGMILFALAAPALAEHFDWNTFLTGEPDPTVAVTAEDAHVDCPEPEGSTETVTDGGSTETVTDGGSTETAVDCDKAVQEVAAELQEYDHPENHGKYVSFVAHCLKGMKGKGEVMRQVAQADEDSQQQMAVKLCAEWKIAQSDGDEEAEVSSRGKGKDDLDAEAEDTDEAEIEGSEEPDDSDEGERGGGKARTKARGSKGRGRR